MCGVFGAVGDQLDLAVVANAAQQAARRGPDGWGIAWLEKGMWQKAAKAQDLTGLETQIRKLTTTRAINGHCRLRTFGSANVTHPFIIDGIALSHNGTVPEHERVARQIGCSEYQCDSELLAIYASKEGYAAALKVVEGKPAVVVVADVEKVVLYRNKHPLYTAKIGSACYWSSCSFDGSEELVADRVVMEIAI